MAYYPTNAVGLSYVTFPAGPTPAGTTLTASASTNTKGSYAQIAASTSFAGNFAQLGWISANSAPFAFLVDLATGAAASEVVLIPNLQVDASGSSLAMGMFETMPCAIPTTTRVAARCQCSTGSSTTTFTFSMMAAGPLPGVTTFVNYGSSTGTSRGVQLDPGGTVNTKGIYAQIVASTSAVTQILMAMFSFGSVSAMATSVWETDIATGAGGSEVVLINDILMRQPNTTTTALMPTSRTFPTYIAASTRIAARASSTGNTAGTRVFDFAIIAGTSPGESAGSSGGAWAYA